MPFENQGGNEYVPNNIVIAGGRDFNNVDLMIDRIQELEKMGIITPKTVLLCGMARGADMMGHKIFTQAGLTIREMPAEWELLGKRAGFDRNTAMALLADVALCFWDGQSKGTAHMIREMERLNKPVYIVNYQ